LITDFLESTPPVAIGDFVRFVERECLPLHDMGDTFPARGGPFHVRGGDGTLRHLSDCAKVDVLIIYAPQDNIRGKE
jgi:hypothetical protein